MKTEDRKTMRRVFEMQCRICKAMSHPMRLEIVEILVNGEISAGSLLATLGTSKANLSKHMNQLTAAGIADLRREGRSVFYRLPHPEIHDACKIMRSILYRQLRKGQQLASAMNSSNRG